MKSNFPNNTSAEIMVVLFILLWYLIGLSDHTRNNMGCSIVFWMVWPIVANNCNVDRHIQHLSSKYHGNRTNPSFVLKTSKAFKNPLFMFVCEDKFWFMWSIKVCLHKYKECNIIIFAEFKIYAWISTKCILQHYTNHQGTAFTTYMQ